MKGRRNRRPYRAFLSFAKTRSYFALVPGKKGVTPQGCPFNCPAFPCQVEYSKDMCPRTLDLLGRAVVLGIPDHLTDRECDERATAIRKVARAYLG